MGSRITGWGFALPEKVVTNDDLAATIDTSDEWIRDRTGIHERRIGSSTTSLAIEAGQKAIDCAGIDKAAVDFLIVATTSADQMMPSTAAYVQAELGLSCGAVDINAACSGFVYGLAQANGLLHTGYQCVLVIGADALSPWVDWNDRGTAILFADGAGAAVLEAASETTILATDLGCDGTATEILRTPHGGKIEMEGREVFRRAVRALTATSTTSMERAGVTAEQIDWVIPHQANVRILESALRKLDIPMEKAVQVLSYTGNSSAASIPTALATAADDGRIQPGDLLLIVGFGAGMTWASAVVRWSPT